MPTVVFDIPYRPNENRAWDVRQDNRVVAQFPSRVDALRFAMNRAAHVEHDSTRALVAVEGADGVRRAFGGDVKRPLDPTLLPVGTLQH
ncbi:hypothetical protein FHW69_001883 [Luteibacter sp. Sphag1AF]|uniref:hypothetical protein n=1 Tax=Luteibacter sp. Sphag1AF TaxID=2587031 RepID=UPI0016188BB0|nr:hypothetical protein [Luteibacter sp. Sphag1AF]MBB3227282.1 hypothetical protein [Luteibacter sp. Sphag1AF]